MKVVITERNIIRTIRHVHQPIIIINPRQQVRGKVAMINPHILRSFYRNPIVANDLPDSNITDNYIGDGRHVQPLPGDKRVGADSDEGGIAANFGASCKCNWNFEVDNFFGVSLY